MGLSDSLQMVNLKVNPPHHTASGGAALVMEVGLCWHSLEFSSTCPVNLLSEAAAWELTSPGRGETFLARCGINLIILSWCVCCGGECCLHTGVSVFFFFSSPIYFEIIVDLQLHRNSMERCQVPFTQFPQ